jgi:hypothetical protein
MGHGQCQPMTTAFLGLRLFQSIHDNSFIDDSNPVAALSEEKNNDE